MITERDIQAVKTKKEYWTKRREETKGNEPVPSEVLPDVYQKIVLRELNLTLRRIFGDSEVEPFIEIREEGKSENKSIRFQVRQAWNPYLKGKDLQVYYSLCSEVRKAINDWKVFRTCKIFMLVYECEEEMTSLNVVYNPRWRRYENFDLMFRSNVQLRRARR